MIGYNFSKTPLPPAKLLRLVSDDEQPTPLPSDFQPNANHIICGRGKKAYEHIGNANFRALVATKLEEYSKSSSKADKSRIVTTVYDELAAEGGFVKQDVKSGQWFTVPENAAREKISQGFRDCLTDQYRSSKKCKQKKRRQAREEATNGDYEPRKRVKSCDAEDEEQQIPLRVKPSIRIRRTSDAYRQLLKFSESIKGSSLGYGSPSRRPSYQDIRPLVCGSRSSLAMTLADFHAEIDADSHIETGFVVDDEEPTQSL